MKKSLLSLAGLAIVVAACAPTPKFTVQGTIEGTPAGNVYLIKYAGKTADTLAKAVITEGKFTLTGTSDSLTDAYLLVEGQRRGTLMFLENAEYTATLNSEKPAENKIEGSSANQTLANQYTEINREARKTQEDLMKEYSEAKQANDTAKLSEIENRFKALGDSVSEKMDALAQANPDSYVVAYILSSQLGGLELNKLIEKYEALGINAKASEPGRKIADQITKLKAVAVGQVAPDFTLKTVAGDSISMHSIKAKVKLIDFWASWCGPCRGENPNVAAIYKDFNPKGLEILSVSLDNNKEAWQKAIEEDKLIWNNVHDEQQVAAKLYAVRGIPHLIILDENNVIVAKNLRGDELKAKIAELLK